LYTSGRRDRAGGSISYQTEFNRFFSGKKKKKKEVQPNAVNREAVKVEGN